MPRPKNNSLLALFKCNSLNQIVCYNEKCDGKPLYKHSANLERHLKLLHPYVYSSYIQKKKILKFPRKLNFEKRLIDFVRTYPILWDKFNADRLNEDLTEKAWAEISFKMEVTVQMCKKKWDNLIEKFRSELIQTPQQNVEADSDLKNSTSNNYKSNWKYFSELLFLRDQIKFTKTSLDMQLDQVENIKIDYIKEESIQSDTLYNDTLESSSHLEYGEELISQNDDREQSRLIDDIIDSTQKDDRETSGPPDDRDDAKLKYDNQISLKESNSKLTFEDTDDSEDYYIEEEKPKKRKRKKLKRMSEIENSDYYDQDSDKMFLLSLLPFMKSIPDKKKLFVRHRIQGVLLEEQKNSS